ncbi:MAG: hypothetical protein LIO96_08130 [Lachnospiraceae bacterium]|nr:hypothetical protein [Lachnospiraceae bacterium]
MHPKAQRLHPHLERVYVAVNSDFDPTGYVQPRSVTWQDGRTFRIEQVKDFRPADTVGLHLSGDCYTVIINGRETHLYFERTDPHLSRSRVGRWFVETYQGKECQK